MLSVVQKIRQRLAFLPVVCLGQNSPVCPVFTGSGRDMERKTAPATDGADGQASRFVPVLFENGPFHRMGCKRVKRRCRRRVRLTTGRQYCRSGRPVDGRRAGMKRAGPDNKGRFAGRPERREPVRSFPLPARGFFHPSRRQNGVGPDLPAERKHVHVLFQVVETG